VIAPGEIRLVWFPFSRNEAESYKKRPVLVLGAVGAPPDQAILVAMVTGNPARFTKPHAGDVPLQDWATLGLKKESVIRARRIWTAEERDFTGPPMGPVDDAVLETVKAELRALLL
jgi:mRNA-degrading endonuclease toxin of MazEF toxin-antitoxin module